MKFFFDTANLDEIRQGVALGVFDGVTTDPTLNDWEKARETLGEVFEPASARTAKP